MVDTLAALSPTLALGVEENITVPVRNHWVIPPDDEDSKENVIVICVFEIEVEGWCQLIVEYLKHVKLLVTQGII